jgi:ABC-2 type transport system ATP-binding protein
MSKNHNISSCSSKETAISIQELTKYYGKQVGIDNLNLEISKGEVFGFLGQNGSGKTTTIRLILNILIPDQGTSFVLGEEITRDNPQIKERIGYLPGELNVPGHYRVEEFLHYMASLKKSLSTRMEELSNRFDLPLKKKFSQLSKGNKQKVGLVLAFMHNPEILILDEPTSGLDPVFQQEIYRMIDEEREKGTTVFFSSHNLDEVQKVCDRVAIIREGKLVTIENVEELSIKIPRKLKAIVNNLDLEPFQNEGIDVKKADKDNGQIELDIFNGRSLSKILELLTQQDLVDISYPPASLEEYFLSKYGPEETELEV